MTRGGGASVEALVWAVAYAALGFQAVFSPAEARSAAALAGLGGGLWLAALALERRAGADRGDRQGNGPVFLALGVFGFLEACGLAAALGGGSTGQAWWFGLAMASAAAGAATARVRAPDDGHFLAQLIFHLPMAAPALALPAALAVSGPAGGAAWPALAASAVDLARPWVVILCVVLPVTLTVDLFVMGYWIAARHGREQAGWSALAALQAAWSVLLIRWGSDGF